jgi:phospholipid/cholesterol/gamma-HCH transport system ATP-binding protein
MTEPSESIISIRGLEKAFGAHAILRGVDLEIPRGEVTVIIGRSGEGKSVLLRHIIGLLEPDAGEVLVDGISMTRASPRERRLLLRRFGMLFQNGALFDSMTVFDNVAFPIRESGQRLGAKLLAEKVREKLALVGLSGVERKIPAELSGGQRKRVALARAVALEPEIILYDEPTTGLDPVRTHAVDEMILETARSLNVTSVVITHDMQAVFEIADHVAMLYDGRVLLRVRPDELRVHPSEVVQAFIHGRALDDASAGQLHDEAGP